MAVSMLDNISYKGNKPDNVRSMFETLSDMVDFREDYLPEIYVTTVVETGKQYMFKKSNTVDPELGKWREVTGGGSTDLTDYYKKFEVNELLDAKANDDDLKSVKETTDLLNNNAETEGSVRYLDTKIYEQSKTYTDEVAATLNKKKSIACDEKPVYTEGATPEEDTITYSIDGEEFTIKADEIWFYYMAANDYNLDGVLSNDEIGLEQTIWIDRIPFTILSFGVDMGEYVSKLKDVVSDYTGEEVETSKIPDIAALHKLEEKIKGEITPGSDAEDISYENSSYPAWTNVKRAIDGIMAKIDYVKPEVKTFSVSPATTTYEVGASTGKLTFSWTYNKDITSQTLTDITLEDENTRSGEYPDLSTTKTFTLSASDGQNTCSKSISISFRNKTYWGSAAIPDDYDSSFILELSKNQFATSKTGKYEMTVGAGEYGFITFPSSFGKLLSVWIGGFEVTVEDCGSISFTNASGGVVTYSIYRTGKSGLGTITMEVK
jgi:hypothetical protein